MLHTYHRINFYARKHWKGLKLYHGFDPSFGSRMYPIRRKFYYQCRDKQRELNGLLSTSEIKVQPQLAAFYLFPWSDRSAQAAIGWTLFLEYQRQLEGSGNPIRAEIENHLKEQTWRMSSQVLQSLIKAITDTLHIKLTLEALSRLEGFEEVEAYRVLICNLTDPQFFSSIEQVLRWTILFEDLLPDTIMDGLSSPVHDLLHRVRPVNAQFLHRLQQTDEGGLLVLGKEWALEILNLIAENYDEREVQSPGFVKRGGKSSVSISIDQGRQKPPHLFPSDDEGQIERILGPTLMEEIKKLVKDLHQAAGAPPVWQAPKFDDLTARIIDPFRPVAEFEGELREGDLCQLTLEDGRSLEVEVLEENLPVSSDMDAIDAIRTHAGPIAEALKCILYKNQEKVLDHKPSRSASQFHSHKLPLYPVTDYVFKRAVNHNRDVLRGRPIIVIAADASGSMSSVVDCLQILTASWTMLPRVKLIAGMYTTASTTEGSKSIVRWISHPKCIRGASWNERLGRIASARQVSMSGNDDAAALLKILKEAQKVATSQDNLYLIHITDTGFTGSFPQSGKSAIGEIDQVIGYFRRRIFKQRLHVTLVALGNSPNKYDEVDELCQISNNIREDYLAIARQLGENLSRRIVTGRK